MTQDPPGAAKGGGKLPGFDTSTANASRMWNYWIGGTDNFLADREAGGRVLEAMPALPVVARMLRRFLAATVDELTASGVRQFLDIGSGLYRQKAVAKPPLRRPVDWVRGIRVSMKACESKVPTSAKGHDRSVTIRRKVSAPSLPGCATPAISAGSRRSDATNAASTHSAMAPPDGYTRILRAAGARASG